MYCQSIEDICTFSILLYQTVSAFSTMRLSKVCRTLVVCSLTGNRKCKCDQCSILHPGNIDVTYLYIAVDVACDFFTATCCEACMISAGTFL